MQVNYDSTEIRFPAKPSDAVRSMLKSHGARWNPRASVWYLSRGHFSPSFVAALTHAVNGTVPEPDYSPCWQCKGDKGIMRNHGPSAPVYCDACYVPIKAEREANRVGNVYFPRSSVRAVNPYERDPGEDAEDRWNESQRGGY